MPRTVRAREVQTSAKAVKPRFQAGRSRQIEVEIHPSYGQPSVLDYKIVQAIFLKMTEVGEPYSGTVAFTKRELARLVGRESWGGKDSHELYHAMMQLRKTSINCCIHNK
jgi:hypothetical protein